MTTLQALAHGLPGISQSTERNSPNDVTKAMRAATMGRLTARSMADAQSSFEGKSGFTGQRELRDDVVHDLAFDIRQPEPAAVIRISELGVVHAQQVEDRGVEVVDGNLVHGGLVADL